MQELIEILDEKLEYITHEIASETITIKVKSKTKNAKCPYCGKESNKIYSKNERSLNDLPIYGKKTILKLQRRKFFCLNENCSQKTFSERFNFFDGRATRTKRLESKVLQVSASQSSLSAAKYLKANVVGISKSTICNLLKKTNENN